MKTHLNERQMETKKWKQMNWNEASERIELCEKEANRIGEMLKAVLPKEMSEYEPMWIYLCVEKALGVTNDFSGDVFCEPNTNECEEIARNLELFNEWIADNWNGVIDKIEDLATHKTKANWKEANLLIAFWSVLDNMPSLIHRLAYHR